MSEPANPQSAPELHDLPPEVRRDLVDKMKALGEETRLRILYALHTREKLNVVQINQYFEEHHIPNAGRVAIVIHMRLQKKGGNDRFY